MKLELLIADPWDFDQSKPIIATVYESGISMSGGWIICQCSPFRHRALDLHSLLLFKRHIGGGALLTDIESRQYVEVNALWRVGGADWTAEDVPGVRADTSIVGGWLIASARKLEGHE